MRLASSLAGEPRGPGSVHRIQRSTCSGERAANSRRVFVAQDAGHGERARRARPLGQMLRKHARGGLVMRDIKYPLHRPGQDLKAPRQAEPCQRIADELRVKLPWQRQGFERGERGCCVSVLDRSRQAPGAQDPRRIARPLIAPAPVARHLPGEIALGDHARARRARQSPRTPTRGISGRAQHRRPAGPEYSGLLAADARQVIAEVIAMIHANRGEHGDIRIDEIGGIKASAESDLEQRHLDARARQRRAARRACCIQRR